MNWDPYHKDVHCSNRYGVACLVEAGGEAFGNQRYRCPSGIVHPALLCIAGLVHCLIVYLNKPLVRLKVQRWELRRWQRVARTSSVKGSEGLPLCHAGYWSLSCY